MHNKFSPVWVQKPVLVQIIDKIEKDIKQQSKVNNVHNYELIVTIYLYYLHKCRLIHCYLTKLLTSPGKTDKNIRTYRAVFLNQVHFY